MEEDIHDELPPWNFKWIVRKELAIMGYPKFKANVNYIVRQGITHVVSLSPEKQPCFEHFPNDLRWTPLDVLEFHPPTLDQIITFIHICERALYNKEAVGVHCRLGKGRSGVLAACFLVHFYQQRPDDAVRNVGRIQPGAIETYAQEKIVHTYYDQIHTEKETEDEVDLYIKTIPRPNWDYKPKPRRIFDYEL